MTNIIEHKGVKYRKVKRKAEVGELVEVFGHTSHWANGIHVVDAVFNGGEHDGHIDYGDYGRRASGYVVLEPVESAGQTPVPSISPELAELLSNLALRLTKVEAGLEPKEADEVDNGTTTQSERIESVCNEVRDLLIRKNHDYGDSFSKQYAKYGVMSGLIRMDDKIRRLETLVSGEEAQVSESIEDTIADLAGYALLTLVELRKGAIE